MDIFLIQGMIKMLTISPRLGEFLIKTTNAKDIDDAFHKIFSGYVAQVL